MIGAKRASILVDDGVASGSTARPACIVARRHGATSVVSATPVVPPRAITELRRNADDVVALDTPEVFYAIEQFYDDFGQTSDSDVVALLTSA